MVAARSNKQRIYLIMCTATGKRYVGSASLVVQRWSRHRQDLRANKHGNPHLQNAWNRYGEASFAFTELECVLDKSRLLEAEQWWLDLLEPEFNVHKKAASPLGRKHSEETKRRMSEARKRYCASHDMSLTPSHRMSISRAQLGQKRPFSEEHKRALSISATGRKLSQKTRDKIAVAHLGKPKVFSVKHKANIKAAWAIRKEASWKINTGS